MTDQGNGPRSTGIRARGPAAGQAGERAGLSKAPAVSSSRAAAEIVAMKKKLAETTALAVKYKQSALKLKEAADQRARQLAISQKQAQALKQELQTQSSLAQQSSERVKSLESDLQDLRILVETQESVVTRQLLQIETTNFEVEQRAAQHEAQVTSLKQQLQLKVEDSQATLLGLHDQLTAKESLIENLERDLRQRQQECIQLQDDLATRPMPDEFAALEQALDDLASVSDEKDALLQNQGQQLAKIQEQLAASREESADLLKTHQTALAEIDGLRHYLSTELEQRQQELQLQMAQSEQNDELHRYQQSLQLQAIQWLEAELYRQTQLGNYYQTALAELQLLEKSQNSQIRQLEAENSWREQAISYLELHLQENQTAKTLLGQQLQQLGQRIAQLQAQVETAAVEHQSLRQELQQSQEQKLFLEQQLSADQAQQKLNEQQQQALIRQFQEQLDLGILEQERLQRSLYDSAEENQQHKSHLSNLHLQIQEQHQQLEFGQKEHQNLTAALELVGQQLQVSLEQTRRNAAQVQQLESTLSVREAEKAELNFLLDTLLEAIAQSEATDLGARRTISRQSKEVEELSQALVTLEETLHSQKSQLQQLQADQIQGRQLQQELLELRAALLTSKAELDQARVDVDLWQRRCEDAQMELPRIGDLEELLAEERQRSQQAEKAIQDNKVQILHLEQQVSGLEHRVSDLDSSSRGRIEELQSELRQREHRLNQTVQAAHQTEQTLVEELRQNQNRLLALEERAQAHQQAWQQEVAELRRGVQLSNELEQSYFTAIRQLEEQLVASETKRRQVEVRTTLEWEDVTTYLTELEAQLLQAREKTRETELLRAQVSELRLFAKELESLLEVERKKQEEIDSLTAALAEARALGSEIEDQLLDSSLENDRLGAETTRLQSLLDETRRQLDYIVGQKALSEEQLQLAQGQVALVLKKFEQAKTVIGTQKKALEVLQRQLEESQIDSQFQRQKSRELQTRLSKEQKNWEGVRNQFQIKINDLEKIQREGESARQQVLGDNAALQLRLSDLSNQFQQLSAAESDLRQQLGPLLEKEAELAITLEEIGSLQNEREQLSEQLKSAQLEQARLLEVEKTLTAEQEGLFEEYNLIQTHLDESQQQLREAQEREMKLRATFEQLRDEDQIQLSRLYQQVEQLDHSLKQKQQALERNQLGWNREKAISSQLQQQTHEQDAQLAAYRSKFEAVVAKVQELKFNLKDRDEQLHHQQQEMQSLQLRVAQAEEGLETTQDTLQEVMRELDEAQSQQAQLRDQVAVACNERDEHQAAVAGQAKVIAGLQNQLDALSKQFDDIQEQLAQRDLDNSDLAELIQERESEVQNLTLTRKALHTQLEAAQQHKTELDRRLAESESSNLKLTDQIVGLQEKVEQLEKLRIELKKSHDRIAELNDKQLTAERELEQKTERGTRLELALTRTVEKLKVAAARIHNLEDDLQHSQTESEALMEELEHNLAQKGELEQMLQNSQAAQTALEEQNAELASHKASLEHALGAAQTNSSRLEEVLSDAQTRQVQLEAELNSATIAQKQLQVTLSQLELQHETFQQETTVRENQLRSELQSRSQECDKLAGQLQEAQNLMQLTEKQIGELEEFIELSGQQIEELETKHAETRQRVRKLEAEKLNLQNQLAQSGKTPNQENAAQLQALEQQLQEERKRVHELSEHNKILQQRHTMEVSTEALEELRQKLKEASTYSSELEEAHLEVSTENAELMQRLQTLEDRLAQTQLKPPQFG